MNAFCATCWPWAAPMSRRALVPLSLESEGKVRALQVYDAVPPGCVGILIRDASFSPHLQPGEIAIVDTTDKGRQPGELYALRMSQRVGGDRKIIVQLLRHGFAGDVSGLWYAFGFRHCYDGGRSIAPSMDGPLKPEFWPEMCVGRVVGVMPCLEDF